MNCMFPRGSRPRWSRRAAWTTPSSTPLLAEGPAGAARDAGGDPEPRRLPGLRRVVLRQRRDHPGGRAGLGYADKLTAVRGRAPRFLLQGVCPLASGRGDTRRTARRGEETRSLSWRGTILERVHQTTEDEDEEHQGRRRVRSANETRGRRRRCSSGCWRSAGWRNGMGTRISTGGVPGAIHLYIGQEAVAVGACTALREDDYVTSTHRPHGHCTRRSST